MVDSKGANTAAQSSGDKPTMTSEQLIEKLKSALKRDGDFPASAKVVSELKMLTTDPKTTANQITEIILREPSLGIRILHLVNSTFYRRAKPIMTVSQAVLQIGMKPLADLCAGLMLLQKFIPAARKDGAFASCLQRTVLTSLLSSSIGTELKSNSKTATGESGYLAGSFAELGTLLLAYYFPQIYESAVKRAESKKVELEQSIQEITGLTPLKISIEVIKALDLPEIYIKVLESADSSAQDYSAKGLPPDQQDILSMSKSVSASRSIVTVVTSNKGQQTLNATLNSLESKFKIDLKLLNKVVGSLPTLFKDHCSTIELNLPPLPEYIASYATLDKPQSEAKESEKVKEEQNQFAQFVDEIRQSVEAREPTASIITTVMETFAWGLNFDRVLLLLISANKRSLQGRMLLGKVDNFDPAQFIRPIGEEAAPNAPDAQAFKVGRPVFNGEPVFENGWPLTAIPIGFGQRALGVIYADKLSASNSELTSREQAAIGVLAELLDRSISIHTR